MEKKLEKLRRLVKELSDRYGNDDPDVCRLQIELKALEAIKPAAKPERRKATPLKRDFQSPTRQYFDASVPGDLT